MNVLYRWLNRISFCWWLLEMLCFIHMVFCNWSLIKCLKKLPASFQYSNLWEFINCILGSTEQGHVRWYIMSLVKWRQELLRVEGSVLDSMTSSDKYAAMFLCSYLSVWCWNENLIQLTSDNLINLLISQIVFTLDLYGVKKIVGIQYGYRGFFDENLPEINVRASLELFYTLLSSFLLYPSEQYHPTFTVISPDGSEHQSCWWKFIGCI